MKKLLPVFIIISILLSACGMFDSSYVVESDYALPAGKENDTGDSLSVSNLSELREAVRIIVAQGGESNSILFESNYNGTPTEDLAAAIWQVRTEDALCAYCVENISYELAQIVSYTEAKITVTYSPRALSVEEITSMPYATPLNETLSDALSQGKERIAVLINRSTISAEDMQTRVSDVYRRHPGLAPREPETTVTMFSGSGTQRLYEIILSSGLSTEEFTERKEKMDAIELPVEEDAGEFERALAAADYLLDCYDPEAADTVYDALIVGKASPEGVALAYVELCRRLNLDCRIVYGQKDWQDYCWNIVRVDGNYYHADLCVSPDKGFLKSDSSFWGSYRWTTSAYPKCSEEAHFEDAEEQPEEQTEEQKEEPPEELLEGPVI